MFWPQSLCPPPTQSMTLGPAQPWGKVVKASGLALMHTRVKTGLRWLWCSKLAHPGFQRRRMSW